MIEEGDKLKLDFGKIGKIAAECPNVIPVTVQNIDTGEVILTAYTNEQAFMKTVETRTLMLWSTSRNALWEKGKTTGNTFELVEIYVNCEQNSLLYKVRPKQGGICHTINKQGKPRNCYYRRVNLNTHELENIDP